MFKIWGAKNRRTNLHKHLGPPFQIRGGTGSLSRFHCYYQNIQVLLCSEKEDQDACVGFSKLNIILHPLDKFSIWAHKPKI